MNYNPAKPVLFLLSILALAALACNLPGSSSVAPENPLRRHLNQQSHPHNQQQRFFQESQISRKSQPPPAHRLSYI